MRDGAVTPRGDRRAPEKLRKARRLELAREQVTLAPAAQAVARELVAFDLRERFLAAGDAAQVHAGDQSLDATTS